MLILIISIVVTPFALAGDTSERVSRLQFTANPNGTFSVVANGIALESLLAKIRETTNLDVYVSEDEKRRPISIDVKNIALIELLRRVAGDNYAIVFEGQRVTDLHLLPKGKTVSDFSGKVQVREKRARLFFMPQNDSKDAVNDYIRKRHEALARLAKEEPDKELQAQISFQGYMVANQVVSFVKENRLDPVTLTIGWKEHGGGHDLQQGESIEDAIKAASLFQKSMIAELQEDANRDVAELRKQGEHGAPLETALTFQKEINEQNAVFQAKGVTYYGIRVAGRADQLYALTSNDKEIRLVDPLWGGLVEKEMSEIYPVKKIPIPLKPNNDNFLPFK